MQGLQKELAQLYLYLGNKDYHRLKALLVKYDQLPVKTCALAVYPRICWHRDIKKEPFKTRVFILLHEYLHIKQDQGVMSEALHRDWDLKVIPARRRQPLITWAMECWTNIHAYKIMAWHPPGLHVDTYDTSHNWLPCETWCAVRILALWKDKKQLKFVETQMARCYDGKARKRKRTP